MASPARDGGDLIRDILALLYLYLQSTVPMFPASFNLNSLRIRSDAAFLVDASEQKTQIHVQKRIIWGFFAVERSLLL